MGPLVPGGMTVGRKSLSFLTRLLIETSRSKSNIVFSNMSVIAVQCTSQMIQNEQVFNEHKIQPAM